VKFLRLLQLTQSLYNWLKLASLFNLPKKALQDIMLRASNRDSPNQPSAKETQSTLVPIPKRHAWYIYPESGFEARYERV